ncbi:DUF937 domain-containing protein [bacterium]|nr:DUF937 domain-containing protein [bacterium]
MGNSILEMIMGRLGGDALRKLGQQAGTDEAEAQQGLSAAVPLLLGAMERNAGDTDGAASLTGALERDHDGSILDNVGGFLDAPEQGNGAGILQHVLGDKRTGVEEKLAEKTGLASGSLGKLLEMAAPLVMGALGRRQREGGIGMEQLSQFLGGQREESESSAGLLGMVSGLLDADKDGDVLDDIAGLTGKLFGK